MLPKRVRREECETLDLLDDLEKLDTTDPMVFIIYVNEFTLYSGRHQKIS